LKGIFFNLKLHKHKINLYYDKSLHFLYNHILGENSFKRGKKQRIDIKHPTYITVPSLDQYPGKSQEELGQGAMFVFSVPYL